jgi:hypothetical protein
MTSCGQVGLEENPIEARAWKFGAIGHGRHLQGENTMEPTRKIKDLSPSTIVIMLDVFGIPEYREAACSTGADYFLDANAIVAHGISALVKTTLLEKGFSPAR